MQASVSKDRHLYIGGSDIPIIMNISTFKTRFDLLLEKAQLKEDEFEGNVYTEYGNRMESKIRDYINQSLGKNFHEGQHIKDDIRLHTDGEDYASILEIKTTSKIYKTVDEYIVYLVQLLFYMVHAEKETGILAVYERPELFDDNFDENRLQIFMIDKSNYKDLIEKINTEVDKFRSDLEKVKANPLITEEELQPTELIELSNQVVALEERLKEYKAIEDEQKKVKSELKTAMEKYNVKKWTTNNGVQITLVDDTPDKEVQKFNEEKFIQENLELYEKYLETKIQKGRSGYVKVTL